MTIFTDITAGDVCRVLACCRHSVVTAAAIANDTSMIEIGRNPGCGRMAVITGIGAGDVRGMFSGGNHTVMARTAAADDLSVID